ncbi:hypothetical protein OE88DRAFT_1649146 [Heliocybe sulcata]|uniref:DUF6532 domain-containing protein n=1 Tax=Heliocybe sulcata TaxID=5364 RepID=A0A5C3MVY6_9AGAM|nr:hypothetical protein OE88DRAFT_1649146 [Heliocybe sulcata]
MQKAANKQRVEWLLADRFHCKDPDTQSGQFQHPIIEEIVHSVWFNNRNGLGCLYQQAFSPIPSSTLALVVAAIYDDFLVAIEQYESGAIADVWRSYRTKVFKRGLKNARAQREEARKPVAGLLLDEDVQAEMLRLKESLAEDSDSEDEIPRASE